MQHCSTVDPTRTINKPFPLVGACIVIFIGMKPIDAALLSLAASFNLVHGSTNLTWDCTRPWPQLDLFLPVCLTRGRDVLRHYEVETHFLRSLLLFWPLKLSKTTLTGKFFVNLSNMTTLYFYHLSIPYSCC